MGLPGSQVTLAKPGPRGHYAHTAAIETWDRLLESGTGVVGQAMHISILGTPHSPLYTSILFTGRYSDHTIQPPSLIPCPGCPKGRAKTLCYLCSCQPHTAWHTMGAQ